MLRPIDEYFQRQSEPAKSCLEFLRELILSSDPRISESWKYGMPFYCFDGKMMCYLWAQKDTGHPYLGIVDGKKIEMDGLIREKRARMKIFPVDPGKDLPVRKLKTIISKMIALRS